MTRAFNENIRCPECGWVFDPQTGFERWMRDEPDLHSIQRSIVRFDLDVLLHRYRTPEDGKGPRNVQCMMFIEVKTHDAALNESQQDTLSMLSQVLRNRRKNIHHDKRGVHATDHVPPAQVLSRKLKTRVKLRLFGGHLLQLSNTTPLDSQRMRWDGKEIDIAKLKALLRFDLDPDSLKPMDWRRRSQSWKPEFRQALLRV